MMNMKSIELRIFLDLIQTGSFSKTAINHDMAQAKVSKLINSLEAKIGMRLFDRDVRPVRLTPFGLELYPYIEEHIVGLQNLSDIVGKYKQDPQGKVNINAPSGIQAFLAKTIIPAFSAQHSDIKLNFTTQSPRHGDYFSGTELLDDCDILISYMPPKINHVVARKLSPVRLNLYATDDFYQAHPFTHPEELAGHPFILINSFMTSPFTNDLLFTDHQTGEVINITVSGRLKFDNGYTAMEYCRAGLGYMLHPEIMTEEGGGVIPRLNERFGFYLQPYIIYRKRENLPRKVITVLDFLLERLQQDPVQNGDANV